MKSSRKMGKTEDWLADGGPKRRPKPSQSEQSQPGLEGHWSRPESHGILSGLPWVTISMRHEGMLGVLSTALTHEIPTPFYLPLTFVDICVFWKEVASRTDLSLVLQKPTTTGLLYFLGPFSPWPSTLLFAGLSKPEPCQTTSPHSVCADMLLSDKMSSMLSPWTYCTFKRESL